MGFDPRIERTTEWWDRISKKGKWKPKRIVRDSLLRRKVFERDQGFCANGCGYDAKWIHDHIVPLWQGGKDNLENSQTLCRRCEKPKTSDEATKRAKSDRIRARHELMKQRRSIPPLKTGK